jgi:hypothetical protein
VWVFFFGLVWIILIVEYSICYTYIYTLLVVDYNSEEEEEDITYICTVYTVSTVMILITGDSNIFFFHKIGIVFCSISRLQLMSASLTKG